MGCGVSVCGVNETEINDAMWFYFASDSFRTRCLDIVFLHHPA